MSGFQRVATLCLVIFTGLLVACTEPESQAPRERAEPLVTGLPDFTRLVEKEGPAVVNISTITRQDEDSVRDQLEQLPPQGRSSGRTGPERTNQRKPSDH